MTLQGHAPDQNYFYKRVTEECPFSDCCKKPAYKCRRLDKAKTVHGAKRKVQQVLDDFTSCSQCGKPCSVHMKPVTYNKRFKGTDRTAS